MGFISATALLNRISKQGKEQHDLPPPALPGSGKGYILSLYFKAPLFLEFLVQPTITYHPEPAQTRLA
jgi:hypothetical protein